MKLKKMFKNFYLGLSKLGLTKPSVIVMVDGGLCSQMHQFLLGEIIKRKGRNVEYDLTFFEKGLDLDGNQTRQLIVPRLFPSFDYKRASKFKVVLYKLFFGYRGRHPKEEDLQWLNKVAPVLLSGYYSDIPEMYERDGIFNEIWRVDDSLLSKDKQPLLSEIKHKQSVGVHIRRGDLSSYNSTYGAPVTNDYVTKGINFFLRERNNPKFFFFSDDTSFVTDVLIPSLKLDIEYEVVESDQLKVDDDFILLAYCKDLITSKGTMGKYVAVYGNAKDVVMANDDRQQYIIDSVECEKILL